MAFVYTDLSCIGSGNGFKLWAYTTTDTAATCDTANYFLDAVDRLSVGDWILLQATTGGTREDGILIVNARSASAVDTSNFSPLPTPGGGAKVYMQLEMADISTADEAYTVAPIAGTITKISSVIDGTIASADADLTGKIGGVAITNGLITVTASGSAAEDVDSVVPSGANTVAIGSVIEVETDGASTNTVKVAIVVEITPSLVDSD
jgi:hypothetical protein